MSETTTQETTTQDATVELLFSRDGRLYYVTALDHNRPTSWVAVEPNENGKYEVLSFVMHEVKSGRSERRPETDPLVVRYAQAERWPARGTSEWTIAVMRVSENHYKSLADAKRIAEFYEREIARLDALLVAYAPPGIPLGDRRNRA